MSSIDVVDENQNEEIESNRLGSDPPFKTICKLTIGPLLAQVTQTFYGLMDSFWISKSIGEKGLTTMSIVTVVDFINIAFGQYFNAAMSTRISFLFGAKLRKECAQVCVDLLRCNIIMGILIPAILLPCAKKLMRWYGADDEIADMCFDYLLPSLCCSMINYTYLSICGFLQAMSYSIVYGICQLSSGLLNMLCFDPAFLMGFKTGMWGASLATAISNFIPMLVLYILLFRGKFSIKLDFKLYLNKFNHHTFSALRVSLSQLISNLASSLPVLFLAKFVAQAAKNANDYTQIMAGWNVMERVYAFAISVCNALNQGFLPAASYCYGSGRLHRFLRLGLIAFGFGMLWLAIVCILIESLAPQIASIWGKDKSFLKTTSKMLRLGFATVILNPLTFITTATLQALKKVLISVIVSCLTLLIPIPVFSLILYYTNKNDPVRLFFAYIGHDLWAFCIIMIVMIWKIRFLFKEKPSDQGEISLKKDTNDDSKETSSKEQNNNISSVNSDNDEHEEINTI